MSTPQAVRDSAPFGPAQGFTGETLHGAAFTVSAADNARVVRRVVHQEAMRVEADSEDVRLVYMPLRDDRAIIAIRGIGLDVSIFVRPEAAAELRDKIHAFTIGAAAIERAQRRAKAQAGVLDGAQKAERKPRGRAAEAWQNTRNAQAWSRPLGHGDGWLS